MIHVFEISLVDLFRNPIPWSFTDQLVVELLDGLDFMILKVDVGLICDHHDEHLRSNQEMLVN